MLYKDFKERKKKVKELIRKNPNATHRDIKKKLHTKVEKVYHGGMEEAFRDAGVKFPRTFKRKSKEENRVIIIDYLKKHPKAGGHTITKDTKINPSNIFSSIKEAYKEAGIMYPREESYKESPQEKREHLIGIVRTNPQATISQLMEEVRTNPYRLFDNIKELYEKAGVRRILGYEKRTLNIKEKIINFIRNNPLATQREINKSCKTHVQEMFAEGIFGAYKEAGIKFPYGRLRMYGAAIKEINKRARSFEDKIALKLSGYGKVNRLIKTKRGFADIILERKDKKIVIEIKDYKAKDVSISQVKQLNRYLEDCKCNLGILICHKKPRKDSFLIGENKIFILEESELDKIPKITEGDCRSMV